MHQIVSLIRIARQPACVTPENCELAVDIEAVCIGRHAVYTRARAKLFPKPRLFLPWTLAVENRTDAGEDWTETLGSERLSGALLDRITHHVNILEMNGDSHRLAQSRARKAG